MLRALWLVVAHDQLEYKHMDDVKGNLCSLFCSMAQMARGFENICEIISDLASGSLEKRYLQRRKMEKRRQKRPVI